MIETEKACAAKRDREVKAGAPSRLSKLRRMRGVCNLSSQLLGRVPIPCWSLHDPLKMEPLPKIKGSWTNF